MRPGVALRCGGERAPRPSRSPARSPATDPVAKRRFWAYAAAFGALWGTVEITLGAFLHSLHLPFTSSILAAIGAGLLVAQRQLLPVRGSSLAVGLIAALCKSLSPGGIILGPMVAIGFEALLVEVSLLLAPRALLSAVLAGAVSAAWTLFHGVLSRFVVYGGTVIDLYLAVLRKTDEVLGVRHGGWLAVVGLVSLVAFVGATGGVVGRRVGAESRRRLTRRTGEAAA